MLGRRMANSGIGIGTSPRQDGRTINNEVARPDQPSPDGGQHREDEKRLGRRRCGGLSALALLGGTGNTWPPIAAQGQATGQG